MRASSRWVVLLGLGLSLCVPASMGARTQPQPPAGPSREVLRQRIERRLEEMERLEDELRAALAELDAGAAPERVQHRLRGEFAESRRMISLFGSGASRTQAPGQRQALRRLASHAPDLAEEWRATLAQEPDEGRRLLAWVGPRLRELEAERDEELRRVRIEEIRQGPALARAARALAAAMEEAGEAERAEARAALREVLGRLHDLRLEIRQREVQLLAQRLDALRRELERSAAERERALDRQIAGLEERLARDDAGAAPGDRAPATDRPGPR